MVEPLKAAGPSRVPVPFCRRVYIQSRRSWLRLAGRRQVNLDARLAEPAGERARGVVVNGVRGPVDPLDSSHAPPPLSQGNRL